MTEPRLVLCGDSTLVLELDEVIDPAVNARVIAIAGLARRAGWTGVQDVVPTFRTVAVAFDPLRADVTSIAADLKRFAAIARPDIFERPPTVVPVCYGGEFGPDLETLAARAGCPAEEVIERHRTPIYRVYMVGFVPGFAYMGIVDPVISAPRHAKPRLRVPAGSVGIAGRQTGIYPMETPAGWQIIGRTPLRPFDTSREPPFLFHAGDSVRFVPIDRAEFDRAAG